MSFMVALAVGAKLYGDHQAREAQKAALAEQAAAKREQAVELMARLKINTTALTKKGQGFQQDQVASFAKGGVDVGSQAVLLAMEDTQSKIDLNISNITRSAKFQSDQLRKGADIDIKTQGAIDQAGFFQDIGTIAGGAS